MKWLSRLFRSKPASDPPAKKEISLRQGAPEFDLFIAEGTLKLGENLSHGAQHLADLLKVDPANPEWRALVDRYVEAAGADIDALVPDTDPRHASTEALRAYLWQLQGRTADAVSRLVDVSRTLGDARYLHAWVLEWLEAEGVAEALPEDTGLAVFGNVMTLSESAHVASARTLQFVRRWARLVERVAPGYSPSGLLVMIRAGLLRRAGMYDDALAVAGPIDQAKEFSHAAAIGLALRSKGEFEASAQAFARALELEPDNITGYLEAGDSHFEAKDWKKALTQYDSALAMEPSQAWAEPSACYCRWKLDGDDAWMQRLQSLMSADNRRAHELVFRELGALPESGDATANVLRQMRKAWTENPPKVENPGGDVKLTLSTLEAPSNRLAYGLLMGAFKQNATLKVTVTSIPSIDPRVCIADVKHLLWRFDGVEPSPALPAPSPEVSASIAKLAAETYDPQTNWAHASHVALDLGAGKVSEILAVTVHPPAMPEGTHELAWLPRVQLTALQVVGQIDPGWHGSMRREALLSVLHGPRDWTTAAAIRVLAHIGREEPAHAVDIHKAFERLAEVVPSEGYWDWVETLYAQWETLPYLFDNEREELRRKRAALEA
jgi:tetratricopeptide (TPR) repeat protein